jgi:hypothetical protein
MSCAQTALAKATQHDTKKSTKYSVIMAEGRRKVSYFAP